MGVIAVIGVGVMGGPREMQRVSGWVAGSVGVVAAIGIEKVEKAGKGGGKLVSGG